ncbi:MAG: YggT family protein [Chloroflexi bacterium]|nr:YggT family protein [Chloroflexota bacterium]
MNPLFAVLFWALQVYQLILLARVLMSWIPNLDPNNPIARMLYQVTEPVLAPIRNALPPLGGIDLSPLVVFLGISVIMQLVV